MSKVDGAESTKLDTAVLIFVSICPEVKKELISFGLTTLPVTKLLKLPVIVTGSPVLTVTLAELTPAEVTCMD